MPEPSSKPDIVDIRIHSKHDALDSEHDLRRQIIEGLLQPSGQKSLPTLLLYDELGLRLYDDITTEAAEYYLFAAEEEILQKHADEIAQVMHWRDDGQANIGEVVLELGAGALRKTSHILLGLSHLISEPLTFTAPITYYALDLEKRELERTLSQLAMSEVGNKLQGKVETKGICATYDGGLKFIEEGGLQGRDVPISISHGCSEHYKLATSARDSSPGSNSTKSADIETDTTAPSTPDVSQPPLHILFLGSSHGNFSRREGAEFLRSLPLRPGSGDTLLIGLDHDNGQQKIEEAYNDKKGITRQFIMNGLKAAGRALGDENLFQENKWEYVNCYNTELRCHEAYYKSRCDQTVQNPSGNEQFTFLANELLKVEVSHKFSEADVHKLFTEAKLRPIQRWTDSASQYSLWLLERPPFSFPLLSHPKPSTSEEVSRPSYSVSPFGVPCMEDWENVWALWDFITRMIPPSMLFQKPIDLRHICLFYLGHIPTFLDIHLSRVLGEPHTEPENFKYIFERGIDPNVDDPNECHPHSEVPQCDEEWPSRRTILQFQSKVRSRLRNIYENVESGKISMTRKMGRVLFMTHEHEALHAETLLYMLIQRAGTGTIPPPGFTAPPWESLSTFWDSAPGPISSTVTLGPTTVSLGHDDLEAHDILVDGTVKLEGHEFGWDNEHPKREVHVNEFRIEWRPVTNGKFYDFYKSSDNGTIELPASWVEIAGDIQVRTLYGPVPMKIARQWPVVTTYNNLSKYAIVKGGRIPTEPELRVFFDKFESGYEGGGNIGFRNWHSVPSTMGGERSGGKGHNGGVWEWTSTVFDKYDGFVPSELYPGYSMDFFDGHHHVVLGGSYATVPRIAERRTVRNWYQTNYPYPWIGARIAYDIEK